MPNANTNLSFLEEFIAKHYSRQPAWVRTITFLLFVLVLVYGIWRAIGGQHVVSGSIYYVQTQKAENRNVKRPAKGHEIGIGEMQFGTNSKGFYHAVFGPFEYAQLLLSGKLKVSILKDDLTLDEPTILFERANSRFQSIEVPLRAESRKESGFVPGSLRPPDSVFSAWAGPPPEREGRLAVYMIRLASGLPEVHEVSSELQCDKQTRGLLATRTGRSSGPIPVITGEPMVFGNDYYFPFPEGGTDAQVSVRITARMGYFSTHLETFPVPPRLEAGRMVALAGNRGSRMEVMFTFPYEVTLFDKGDLAGRKEGLSDALVRNGLVLRETPAPLGYRSQTNAVFGGKAVPFTAIQSVLRAVGQQGIGIKTIEYRLELKSGNPNQIQIGGSIACDDYAPIPSARLEAIRAARSEEEFVKLIAPYSSCAPALPRPRVAPRKR